MTNWTTFASAGERVTTWYYSRTRGWLTNKRYPDGAGPDYTYTFGGRLKTRTWARTGTGGQRIVTTYTYGFDDGASGNDSADLIGVGYANDPAQTPSVTYVYDRRGRQQTVTRNGITTSLSYNDANELLSESYSGGTLSGLSPEQGYDNLLRRTSVASKKNGSALGSATYYGYESTSSRLQGVTNGVNSATYSYLANSPLVSQIVFKQNTTVRMTTTKQPDNLHPVRYRVTVGGAQSIRSPRSDAGSLITMTVSHGVNRLTSITSTPTGAGAPPVSFAYLYNAANERYRVTLNDGSYWLCDYDALGQVRSGKKYWSDGTPVAGQQFEYTQDDIGNRTQTKAGGDSSGAGLRPATYMPNNLNQYTSRTVPNAADILGTADAAATVTVNSQATYRKGAYYHKALTLDNSAKAIFPVVKVSTVYGGNSSNVYGKVFLPKTPEAYGYDLDGNLTSDGRWNYTWDGENRLIKMESLTNAPPVFRYRLEFEYDWQGRRIKKKVTNLGTWAVLLNNKFLYDLPTARLPDGQGQAGVWNLSAELNATNNAVIRSYMWGLDLSGTPQGAGGVGGLLAVNDAANGVHFVAYDGNGNVAALVKATDRTVSAQYEYRPFAEPIRVTGSMGKVNPLRFSTKYTDDESGFLDYGHRYYDPLTGRWLNRDPLGNKLENNLYQFVRNNPVTHVDALGLSFIQCDGAGHYEVVLDTEEHLNLPCHIDHELQHIQDYKTRYGENSCTGKARGDLPHEGAEYQEFVRQSECNAAFREKDCAWKPCWMMRRLTQVEKAEVNRAAEHELRFDKCGKMPYEIRPY